MERDLAARGRFRTLGSATCGRSATLRRMRSFPIELRVRTPCDVPSDVLMDSEEGYYCQSCEKVVHDLSRLTFDEAEALFRSARRHGARVCAQMLVRKADGAILLADGYASPPSAKRRLPLAAHSMAAAGAVMLAACANTPQPIPELPMASSAAPVSQPSPSPIEPIPAPVAAAPPPVEPMGGVETEPEFPAPQVVPQAVSKGPAHPPQKPKGKKPNHQMMRGDVAL